MDVVALVVAIAAALGAVGAWVAAHRSNGIARKAQRFVEAQADRSSDTVSWRPIASEDGRRYDFWNESSEHTAYGAQAFALLLSKDGGKNTAPVVSPERDTPPKFVINLHLDPETVSTVDANGQVALVIGVAWRTAKGSTRRQLFDWDVLKDVGP